MQEYNSPEEYIKDVQRYIRWSRAKVVATRELSDHINDQYDALRENGLNQKEAMRKAIEEMGDADFSYYRSVPVKPLLSSFSFTGKYRIFTTARFLFGVS